MEGNKNQEIKERRDIQDNICGRLSVLESDFEALKEEVCALERKMKGVERENEVLKGQFLKCKRNCRKRNLRG